MLNRIYKIKNFVALLSCLVCLTVSVVCLSVSVKAETLFGTQASSLLISGVSGINLPAGNINVYSYTDWINVPYTEERTGNTMFYYNADFYSVIPFKIVFPSDWAGRYLNGNVSIRYNLSHPMNFYYAINQTFSPTIFNDYTERYQISQDSYDFDGLNISVSPQNAGGNDYFFLDLTFNNFYIPINAANTVYDFGFDLDYHFSFNASFTSQVGMYDHPEPGRLTAVTSQVQAVSPSNEGAVLRGGSVQLDNSYYTLIQALYESDVTTLLTGIDNYLSSWIGTNPQLITNNWEDFSATIINTLGNIAALEGSASPIIPAINQIYSLLFNAMDQAGYLTTWFTNFYTVMSSQDDHLDNIDDELHTQYAYSLGTYLANVYFALTGWNDTVGNGVTQNTLNAKMNNRWKEIIMLGLKEYFGEKPSAADTSAYATQAADVQSAVDNQHTQEQAVYDSAMTQFNTFVSAGFFAANVQIMPASVWYVSAINAVHSRLGKLQIVITVAFALGLITAILGVVNRFHFTPGSDAYKRNGIGFHP